MSIGTIIGLVISTYFVGLLVTLYTIHRVPTFYRFHQRPGEDSMITAVFWPFAVSSMLLIAVWKLFVSLTSKASIPNPFKLMKQLGDQGRMKRR